LIQSYEELVKSGKITIENVSKSEGVVEKYDQRSNFIPTNRDLENKIEYFMRIYNVRKVVKKFAIEVS